MRCRICKNESTEHYNETCTTCLKDIMRWLEDNDDMIVNKAYHRTLLQKELVMNEIEALMSSIR